MRQAYPELDTPGLEGIVLGGVTSVIYSPIDLGCGLEDAECPYCLGYDRKDARRLGMNSLMYAMTH